MTTATCEYSESTLFLHPLPLLNISDYCTRGTLKGQTIFIGALLGTRTGRNIVIHNACELLIDDNLPSVVVDVQYLDRKIQLYQTNFPDHSLLGWFYINTESTSLTPDATCLKVQEQISELYDVPILLIFNPKRKSQSATSQLPLKGYEVVYRGHGDNDKSDAVSSCSSTSVAASSFIEIVHIKVESEEAERIGVDDIIREGQSHGDEGEYDYQQKADTDLPPTTNLGRSLLSSHITKETRAIEIFHNRLTIIQSYIKSVRAGLIPADRSLIRQINLCVEQLSRNLSDDPDYPELSDSLGRQEFEVLTTYLTASITKGERVGLDLSSKRSYLTNQAVDTSTPTGDYTEVI